MSRKHYVAIAEKINAALAEVRAGDLNAEESVRRIAEGIADVAGDDNDRFDCHRFLRACGVR